MRASPKTHGLRTATLRAILTPTLRHGLEAGVPGCGGSQDRQRGEQPKLRGQAAAQVVVLKGPARGAPERDHAWGNARRTQRAGSATRVLPLPTATFRARPPPPLPRLGGGGCRGAVAHSFVRLVSSPKCLACRPVPCMGGRRQRVAPVLVASSERRARSDQSLDCRRPAMLGCEVQQCPLLRVYCLERRARTDEGLDAIDVAHRSLPRRAEP